MSDPAAAAKTKLIDKKTKIYYLSPSISMKYSWKTYQVGKKVKIIAKSDLYKNGVLYKDEYVPTHWDEVITISKISAKKLKVSLVNNGDQWAPYYVSTKLTALKYYWKSYRPKVLFTGSRFSATG